MAAQAAVVLTDAAGTPVNRSFGPRGVDKTSGVAWWYYLADGTIAGYNTLSQSVRQATPQSDRAKVAFKLVIPTLETLSTTGTSAGYTAGPRVAYECLASLEFVLPSRSSLQNRKDLRAMVLDLANEQVLIDAVENLDPAW